MVKRRPVYQFKIELQDIEPKIWCKIQVSDLYSFWDLHVAIVDAMGWNDFHLHQFETKDPESGQPLWIVMPTCDDDDYWPEEVTTLLDYETKIKELFSENLKIMEYLYDFGDGWRHTIYFEGVYVKEPKRKYPICLAGENACPPEDVGGLHGYMQCLKIIRDPADEEHESMLEWLGGEYDPAPKKVKFDSPYKRFQMTYYDE